MKWQVQEAKQRFSELLRATQAGEPQIITKHGEAVAVVIDYAQYEALNGVKVSFVDFLTKGEPVFPDDFVIHRDREPAREIDLSL